MTSYNSRPSTSNSSEAPKDYEVLIILNYSAVNLWPNW